MLLTFHFIHFHFLFSTNANCMLDCCVENEHQINVVWCNKSQHEHPDVSANIFFCEERKKHLFLWNSIFHNAPKNYSVCVWKISDLKHIYCYNAIYYGWQYSCERGEINLSAEWKYLHTSNWNALSKVWQLTRINLSIKMYHFENLKFMMTKRFFNPLTLEMGENKKFFFDLC